MVPLPLELRKFLGLKNEDDPSQRIIKPEPAGTVRVCVLRGRNLPPKDITTSILYPQIILKDPKKFFLELMPARRGCDPFVQIKVGSAEFYSKTIHRTTDPLFNLTCDIPVDSTLEGNVEISIFDEDVSSNDDLVGKTEEELEFISKFCKGMDQLTSYYH